MDLTPEEIRAEVERRRQRARDLKIREVLWGLEKSFRSYLYWLHKDPQFAKRLIYSGVELSDNEARFSLGQMTLKVFYRKGKRLSEDFGGIESVTTHGTLTLELNDDSVFEFEVSETVDSLPDFPGFSESLGQIARFIEGPWVTEIVEFAQRVKAYEQAAWKERNAPREAQQAAELRKRFGL